MKTLTVYVTDDGARFDDRTKAEAHEALLHAVDAILAALPECPSLGDGQFFQHPDIQVVAKARLDLYTLWLAGKPPMETVLTRLRANEPMNGTGLDLHLSEAPAPLRRAWGRLIRIDRLGREWSQPYYVDHPQEGSEVPSTLGRLLAP